MKKVFGVLLFSGSLFMLAGCDGGGGSGGTVTDGAQQSAVEQYEANLEAAEADLNAAGAAVEEDVQ